VKPGLIKKGKYMDYSRTVVFENIADFDFTPQLGAMYGGVGYTIKSGERMLFPWDLADHLAGALAKQMYLKKDKSLSQYDPKDPTGGLGAVLWNDEQIATLKAKMLGDPVLAPKEVVLTEAQKVQAKVEELNLAEPEISPVGYKDKAEVILELQKKGLQFDARQSKANLEKLLV
jgi:hypothetical protein